MEDSEAEHEVFRFLESALREQGLEKGHGLHSRMAKLLGVSESTITRIAQRVHREGTAKDG